MRKVIFVLCLFLVFLVSQVAMAQAKPPEVTAKAAIVIEAKTGKILYEHNSRQKMYPASTTKIMTLIVALEHGNVNDIVTTSANAASTEGSSIWLSQGEQMKLLDLLYGAALVSGNDATVAVAEHISGSVEAFAKLMTEKAQAIGAVDTNFTNSSGLPDPRHVTTAYDLAKIAAYGYKNPLFAEIVSTKYKVIPWPGKDHSRELYNANKLLRLYEGANGVKTGYTDAAGRCLVSGANRDGVQLIAVVLDSEYMWEDSIALLDYGFSVVKPVIIFNQGDIMKTIRVADGKQESVKAVALTNLVLPVAEDEKDPYRTVIEAPGKVKAPVVSGQKLGIVKTFYKDTEIASVDLVAAEGVERKSFFGTVWTSMWKFFAYLVRSLA